MKLVYETLYPNNGKRPLAPTEPIGSKQIEELSQYRLSGLLPSHIEAKANAKELFGAGPVWTNQLFLGTQMGRNTPRKTWHSPVGVDVIVPARDSENSYVMLDFTPGAGFDFSLWHRAHAEFYNSIYGNYFKKLPKLIKVTYSQEAAIQTNYAPGPCADYPILMGPTMAPRFDEQGEIKWFSMAEFRTANPHVGEVTHTIPAPIVGVSDAELRMAIAMVAGNQSLPDKQCLDMIRGLLGAPVPGGGVSGPSV